MLYSIGGGGLGARGGGVLRCKLMGVRLEIPFEITSPWLLDPAYRGFLPESRTPL